MYAFEEEFNILLAITNTEDEARVLIEEEFNRQYEGLDNVKDPFQLCAEVIFEKNKIYKSTGDGMNAMFLPSLIPIIIKCLLIMLIVHH